MEGGYAMKNLIFTAVLLFLLTGCTREAADKSSNKETQLLIQEIQKLKDELAERPNLSADQLRNSMNLSLRTFNAMLKKDYDYLQSISDSGVTINSDTNSFHFEGHHDQNFINSMDYSKLEYRFHDKKNDKITVGFAENSVEYYFEFIQEGETMLLHTFTTN
jgi:hypothetical protein